MKHRFSRDDLKRLILPLFFEQLLVMLVGAADTFMVSFAGDAAVSGVSLVNMFVTFFIYVFTALEKLADSLELNVIRFWEKVMK